MIESTRIRDYWHPVALATEVGDKPIGRKLLDTPLVLWRSPAGVHAMVDQCVHRGTRLSLGWIDAGELVCPYHGWSFDAAGRVTFIPAHPPERKLPESTRLARFHCMEQYGLVFVCLGEPARPLYAVPEFTDPAFRTHILGPIYWQTSAARSFENFIDEAHLPWVHAGLLGNRRTVPIIPSREVTENPRGFYFDYKSECRDRLDPSRMTLNLLTYDVLLPYELYHENVTPDGERVIDLFYTVPISATESARFMIVARNFALQEPSERFAKFTLGVWEQDRTIVESQQPAEVPLEWRDEFHLGGADGPSVRYRRMLRSMKREASA